MAASGSSRRRSRHPPAPGLLSAGSTRSIIDMEHGGLLGITETAKLDPCHEDRWRGCHRENARPGPDSHPPGTRRRGAGCARAGNPKCCRSTTQVMYRRRWSYRALTRALVHGRPAVANRSDQDSGLWSVRTRTVDSARDPRRSSDSSIQRHQWGGNRLGKCHIGGVVAGQIFA